MAKNSAKNVSKNLSVKRSPEILIILNNMLEMKLQTTLTRVIKKQ